VFTQLKPTIQKKLLLVQTLGRSNFSASKEPDELLNPWCPWWLWLSFKKKPFKNMKSCFFL